MQYNPGRSSGTGIRPLQHTLRASEEPNMTNVARPTESYSVDANSMTSS